MSPTKTIDTCTRTNSKPEDYTGPALEEVINIDREKKRDNNKFSEREIICSRMESEKKKEEQILEKEKRDGL